MMLTHHYNCLLLNILPPVTDVHVMLKRIECEKRVGREYAKDVYTCFVDLEKAYDRVPCEKLRGVLRESGVDGGLQGRTQGGVGVKPTP